MFNVLIKLAIEDQQREFILDYARVPPAMFCAVVLLSTNSDRALSFDSISFRSWPSRPKTEPDPYQSTGD